MQTLFVGQHLIQLKTVASTNTYAIGLLKDVNAIEGTVVNAEEQTQGRGQRGNTWIAAPSVNLTFSVILYPTFLTATNHFFLSKIAALALYDSLSEILQSGQHDIKIKWPNDILVNEKKVAGILIENGFRQETIQYSVIGIGLNVNQEEFGELANKATSLKVLSGKEHITAEILELVCKKLEIRYLQLKSKKGNNIRNEYLDRLYLIGKSHEFKTKDGDLRGKITDVLADGLLEIELGNGEKKLFEVKQIDFGL